MIVHHLNCATMCPPASRLVNDSGNLVCHCILVESDDHLTLIETGLGSADIENPNRLSRGFRLLARPVLDPGETAIEQIVALGYEPSDVRHIMVTHLDLDHAGGLSDFPDATVHVHQAELDAALSQRFTDRGRYRTAQWSHGPNWAPIGEGGDEWFGFESVRPIPERSDLVMVPLAGHSIGHTAVGVRAGHSWLLHCGDGYFHHREMDIENSWCSIGLRLFQRLTEADRRTRLANQARLRTLLRDHGDNVTLVCAHDPTEFAQHADLPEG